jgi:hypothetical protein
LPNTVPPTLLYSLVNPQLLFLSPTSSETEPLLVLEFLHRVVDVLEDFLGSPLVPQKIESNYDVVAQLLGEMCDAGAVSNTEPNALRDVVEVPGWVGKILGAVNLPGYAETSQFILYLATACRRDSCNIDKLTERELITGHRSHRAPPPPSPSKILLSNHL